ncbi:DNA repair protein [Polaribacter glomeratus]|uniref:Uncharacterized protein n=1 Tax=Polaribacter glomeratus TaxID=102 RepID=A0A2S7WYW7_9FLAO|nr:DNA repair protein [Polaribacter glomeratus]PQJ82611.1 hypothetical protein BTO16_08490 [Polaribacter glomeratus]TXD64933.1 DNA repair protein [Polaribacter glomeratus]
MINTLKHKNYLGTIKFSNKDSYFFGKIIGIDDLVNYEAQSMDKLNAVFKEVVSPPSQLRYGCFR